MRWSRRAPCLLGEQLLRARAQQCSDRLVAEDLRDVEELALEHDLVARLREHAIDARIIAAERPDLVASVTSISGPNAGSPVADRVLDGSLTPLAEPAFGALGDMMTLMAGSTDAMVGMSTAGMAQFNAMYPAAVPATPCGAGASEVSGVKYYSWGGIGSLTNPLDLLDPVWILGTTMAGAANDGLIPRCSTHLGTVICDHYWLNHIDETNMIFGLIGALGPKPVALFRAHANRLRNEGL